MDERFFGERGSEVAEQDLWRMRVCLLGSKEVEAMEPFVQRKMDGSRDRIVVEWDSKDVKNRLSEVLFV